MKPQNELLKAALRYAKKGWPVLQVRPRSNKGWTMGWPDTATTDLEKIKRWWKLRPTANVGILCGRRSGLVIIDVDKRSDGFTSLRKLKEDHHFPITSKVRTGGGGAHYYFTTTKAIQKSASKIAKGIDVCGRNSFVVAPPSIHKNGKRYKWLNNEEIKPLPKWLLQRATEKEVTDEPIVKGERHETLTSLAGRYRNLNLNQKKIEALLLIDNERCHPPHDRKDIKRIAKDIAAKNLPRDIQITNAEDIKELKLKWLWPNVFPFSGLSMVIGYEDTGKTWVLGDIAYRVSTGARWPSSTERAPKGIVLICTNEAHMEQRLKKQLKIAGAYMPNIKFFTMESSAQQFNFEQDFERLKQVVDSLKNVRVIIFDPLLQYIKPAGRGDKTLQYADMHIALGQITEYLKEKEIAIIGSNHITKGDPVHPSRMVDGMHGSTAFKAKCSTVWCVVAVPDDEELREFDFGIGNVCVRPVYGKAFRLTNDYKVHWEKGNIIENVEKRLAKQRQAEKPITKFQQCKDFLMEKVFVKKNRHIWSGTMLARALEEGFTQGTYRKAREELKEEGKIDGGKQKNRKIGKFQYWRL